MEQKFLDKLLNKPESYRRKVAYATTAVLGLLIFSAWLLVISATLKTPANTDNTADSAEEIRRKLPSLQEEETAKTQLMKEQENGNLPANSPNGGFDSLRNNSAEEEFKVIER